MFRILKDFFNSHENSVESIHAVIDQELVHSKSFMDQPVMIPLDRPMASIHINSQLGKSNHNSFKIESPMDSVSCSIIILG